MFKHKAFLRVMVSVLTLAVLGAVVPLGVALAATGVTLSATSGRVGTTLVITGTEFPASGSGSVVFGSGSSFAYTYDATSDGTGAVTRTIAVPPAPAGTYNVLVNIGGTSESATFTITASISSSAYYVQVGDQIAITGSGFAASATVTIRYDSSIISTTTSNAYGSFGPVYFTIPASTNSVVHTLYAVDSYGNYWPVSITVQPSVKVTPNSGSVGDTITITGNGFGASRTVTVTFGTTTLSSVPTTDSNGSFSTTFTVPAGTAHSVTVSANDGIVSASATFSLVAGMRLNPTSGVVGTSVTATGTAFGSSRTLTVSMDGAQIATSSTDSNGNFTVTFSIPAATGGEHSITAYDGIYSASATFTVTPQMTVSPMTGIVGTYVTVTGTGFGSNKAVTVSFDNFQVATGTSDSTGGFSISFAVSQSSGAAHIIYATDGVNSGTGQFTTTPKITVDPTSAPTGTQVNISGTGFKANSAISVRLDSGQVKATVTDPNGSFTDKFVVPDVNAGSYTVTASDGTNSATASFTVTASVQISPDTGNVGTTITVKGTGFAGTVTVKYDNTVVTTTTADVNGGFTATFDAPVSVHGNHVITVSDASITLQRDFTMDSTAPPVPALLTPEAGSTQGSRPTFTWSAVSDPSGVSYILEIAADSSFTDIVVQKQGLTVAQYKLDANESLNATGSDAPYYWRVRAVDQASNESAFSTPSTFSVSTFPAWAMWLLIGIGGLIVLLLVLWLGIRMGRRTTD